MFPSRSGPVSVKAVLEGPARQEYCPGNLKDKGCGAVLDGSCIDEEFALSLGLPIMPYRPGSGARYAEPLLVVEQPASPAGFLIAKLSVQVVPDLFKRWHVKFSFGPRAQESILKQLHRDATGALAALTAPPYMLDGPHLSPLVDSALSMSMSSHVSNNSTITGSENIQPLQSYPPHTNSLHVLEGAEATWSGPFPETPAPTANQFHDLTAQVPYPCRASRGFDYSKWCLFRF
ncbi:unnamed protein product [Parascedosporium putredinis]|uniref:Uncharacterized protein n=1 Tax=Parascedosporium putredinis TaxID=1442378 RepID=A0A9P1H7M8_9PEZI|nr:unnamed protein product [Parascedosporium putredinis]CAI7999986.1 unnamed protein product [Parascedosporium putredinis]